MNKSCLKVNGNQESQMDFRRIACCILPHYTLLKRSAVGLPSIFSIKLQMQLGGCQFFQSTGAGGGGVSHSPLPKLVNRIEKPAFTFKRLGICTNEKILLCAHAPILWAERLSRAAEFGLLLEESSLWSLWCLCNICFLTNIQAWALGGGHHTLQQATTVTW